MGIAIVCPPMPPSEADVPVFHRSCHLHGDFLLLPYRRNMVCAKDPPMLHETPGFRNIDKGSDTSCAGKGAPHTGVLYPSLFIIFSTPIDHRTMFNGRLKPSCWTHSKPSMTHELYLPLCQDAGSHTVFTLHITHYHGVGT